MEVFSAANNGETFDWNSGAVLPLEPKNCPLPDSQNLTGNSHEWPEFYAVEFPSTDVFDPADGDFPAIFMNSIPRIQGLPAKEEEEDEVSTGAFSGVASDTGIVVRKRASGDTTVAASRHRIKLQVHRMETGNAGVLNQTVQLDSSDHRVSDNGVSIEDGCIRKVPDEVTSSTFGETIDDEEVYLTKGASIEAEGDAVFPSSLRKDSSKWHIVKRSLRGALREARLLVRSCSCFGSNRFLVGTCLVGAAAAAAMAAYLHQDDD